MTTIRGNLLVLLRQLSTAVVILQIMTAVAVYGQGPALPVFPENFITTGIQYTGKATPHFTGYLAGGHLVSSQGTYAVFGSYWSLDRTNHLVNSTTAGIAQHMRDVSIGGKSVSLYALMGMGASMSSTSATSSTGSSASVVSAAYNGGIYGVRELTKTTKLTVLGQAIKTNGQNVVTVGVGLGWGK